MMRSIFQCLCSVNFSRIFSSPSIKLSWITVSKRIFLFFNFTHLIVPSEFKQFHNITVIRNFHYLNGSHASTYILRLKEVASLSHIRCVGINWNLPLVEYFLILFVQGSGDKKAAEVINLCVVEMSWQSFFSIKIYLFFWSRKCWQRKTKLQGQTVD